MGSILESSQTIMSSNPTPPQKKRWESASIYQIYPASFSDSNTDGLGDVHGILSKVDYIASLGVSAVWLSPIFKSPQRDMGYDISSYREIHAPYGTVEDVEKLIEELHKKGIKLLLDLVVNHTSDEHVWFKESRESRQSLKRDWYFWRDAKYDENGNRHPPNNWASVFGGSAWVWDEGSQQYYLALFLPSQPDLNWEKKEMRESTYTDMRFWLDRGVDGYRIDSMNLMSKNPELPDAEVKDVNAEWQDGSQHFASGPRMHEYIKEMRTEVFDAYEDVMTVGELGFTKDAHSVSQYVASSRHELNMVFTGDIVDMDFGTSKYASSPFVPSRLKNLTKQWQEAMPKFDGWNAVYLDNHDSGRSLSRYASDLPEYRGTAAKMLATYLCTLSGTVFLLQGQEIGMANLPRDASIEAYIDVEGRNAYAEIQKQRGEDADTSDVLVELRLKARDNGRLPMQWDSSKNGGFSSSDKPWMSVNSDYKEWNVESQIDSKDSILTYWKNMLALRKKEEDVFIYGTFEMIDTQEEVFAYTMSKYDGSRKALVLLNFSDQKQSFKSGKFNKWQHLVGGPAQKNAFKDSVMLNPYKGRVFCNW